MVCLRLINSFCLHFGQENGKPKSGIPTKILLVYMLYHNLFYLFKELLALALMINPQTTLLKNNQESSLGSNFTSTHAKPNEK